jgi:hypothetical protein
MYELHFTVFMFVTRISCYTVRSESRCALRLRYVDLVVVSKLPLKCAVVSLYSVVKQRLKCNTGKVCNCLIQFLLTMFRGHYFQHLLQVHIDFPNALYIAFGIIRGLT